VEHPVYLTTVVSVSYYYKTTN